MPARCLPVIVSLLLLSLFGAPIQYAFAQKLDKRPTVTPFKQAKRPPAKQAKLAALAKHTRLAPVKGARAGGFSPAVTSCANPKIPINQGQSLDGALASTDCPLADGTFYDEYTFSAVAGQQVSITLSSNAFDTYLFLLKPSQTTVPATNFNDPFQNDDGGVGGFGTTGGNPNSNSRIPATSGMITLPETGTYSILANSFDANAFGSYTVALTFGSTGGTICPPTPTPITNGQTLNGSLSSSDCTLATQDGTNPFYDAYSFTAQAGQQVSITLTGTGFDAYLLLLAPDGADIAENDNGGGGTNARIPANADFARLPQTGTYIIYTTSANTGQTGSYSVSLNIAATNCPTTPLTIGQTGNGALADTDCRLPEDGSFLDAYTFSGTAGQRIAITMSAPVGSINPFLFLHSPTGSVLASTLNTSNNAVNSVRLPESPGAFFTLPTTGTYTILANSVAAGQTGNYTLTLFGTLQVGQVVISELRFEGPGNGASANDDFVELQNVTNGAVDISGAQLRFDTGAGISAVVLANGTILQAGQHYLATNAATGGYSLSGYAPGELAYTADLANGAAFTLLDGTVADQVGRAGTFGEGTKLAVVSGAAVQNSYVRKLNSGGPQDTNDNAADFVLVAVDPSLLAGAVLGAPGPENRNSPSQRNATIKTSLIETCTDTGTATPAGGCQNRVRTSAPDAANPTLSANGQLLLRRRFTNKTGAQVTRLRFRIVDVTTAPAPGGQADLRVLSSQDITVVRADGGGTVGVKGLTLEQPPAQPNGGGINASLTAGVITPTSPIANGASIAVEFRLGVVQGGTFRFFINVEALP